MSPRIVPLNDPSLSRSIEAALETGQTIVFPTDTVYGIGGNPWDEGVLDRVCRLKNRPQGRPFTLHLPTAAGIERFARLDEAARSAIARLLPGPYTLLLHASSAAPPSAVQDGVIGIRVPDHPLFRGTLADLDRPLFGTSANRSGEPAITEIDEIIERFNSVDLIILGRVGTGESAILDLTVEPPRLVRGSLPHERLDLFSGEKEEGDAGNR